MRRFVILSGIRRKNNRGEAIFNAVNTFFELHDRKWEYCVSVCTDGADALTGSKTGFKAKVTEIAPNVGLVTV